MAAATTTGGGVVAGVSVSGNPDQQGNEWRSSSVRDVAVG